MLYSVKFNFLYVHIAKTGGTSMRAALKSLLWRDPEYYPRFICSKLSGLFGHRLASKIPRHAHVIAAKEMLPHPVFQSLFKFVFVRNPWDLQVSSWHHLRRERPHLTNAHATFEDFIRYKLDPERPYQYHLDTSIDLQSNYVVDLHRNTIVDYIGRFETLEQDFNTLCDKLGITKKILPKKRQAGDRKKDYRSYYTTATTELVGNFFKEDTTRFNYRFE